MPQDNSTSRLLQQSTSCLIAFHNTLRTVNALPMQIPGFFPQGCCFVADRLMQHPHILWCTNNLNSSGRSMILRLRKHGWLIPPSTLKATCQQQPTWWGLHTVGEYFVEDSHPPGALNKQLRSPSTSIPASLCQAAIASCKSSSLTKTLMGPLSI